MNYSPSEINIANIRKALAGEEETIAEYMKFSAIARELGDDVLASSFAEIANEEKVHVGELYALLIKRENVTSYETQGAEEVEEMEETVLANLEKQLMEVPMENYNSKKEYYRAIIEKLL